MHLERLEETWLFERLEHLAVQLSPKVYFALSSIAELEPQRVTRYMTRFNNVWNHGDAPGSCSAEAADAARHQRGEQKNENDADQFDVK